jgi:DNA helicase II / ATP-dependent DNA helicase PcrA
MYGNVHTPKETLVYTINFKRKNAVNTFSNFSNIKLNAPQKRAVTHKVGSIIVIAGAGSGKTRVITARIAHLIIKEHVNPLSIVALTFTNKAATEMKNRLISFLGVNSLLPFVGTFHSYCLLLLRRNARLLPFENFTIMDDSDQKSLIKKILKKNFLEKQFTPSVVSHYISMSKNKMENSSEVFENPLLKEIFLTYESEKTAAHCLDFDDLLIVTLKLFQTNEIFKKNFQSRIRHLLVDEYQDTNVVQHEFLKAMAMRSLPDEPDTFECVMDSICAVGDEDQSIYSWRGAVATNMINFQNDFHPVTTIKIEQNYRSVQPILKAANAVIENNTKRNPKELWSEKKAKNRILHLTCKSGYQEADVIAEYLQSLDTHSVRPTSPTASKGTQGRHILNSKSNEQLEAFSSQTTLSDVAILYRTHFQSRVIEEMLIRNSIPYYIVGGVRFYERKEIKDMLAYMRLIINPFDRTSLFRIVNVPLRGLGSTFETQLYNEWSKNPLLDFKQIINYVIETAAFKITPAKKASLQNFLSIFEKVKPEDKPSEVLELIIQHSDYLNYLKKAYEKTDAETKIENLQEFANSIQQFERDANHSNPSIHFAPQNTQDERPTNSKKPSLIPSDFEQKREIVSRDCDLETFLHEVALLQEKLEETKDSKNCVQMMTLHAAKGLEFDTIIIAGLEEGLLPSSRSLETTTELEEERRLFYVGVTRAKERLLLLRAFARNTYGQISDQVISRFLTEIPRSLVQTTDISEMRMFEIRSLLSQWLTGKTTQSSIKTFGNKQISNKTKTFTPSSTGTAWKKYQPVMHKKFGIGTVKKLEKKDATEYYLTIMFKCGEKRISSSFIKSL